MTDKNLDKVFKEKGLKGLMEESLKLKPTEVKQVLPKHILIKKHDELKSHPYRLNQSDSYLFNYLSKLNEYVKLFTEVMESELENQEDLIKFREFTRSMETAIKKRDIMFIEMYISITHTFIDNKKIEFVYCYLDDGDYYKVDLSNKIEVIESVEEYSEAIKESEKSKDYKSRPDYKLLLKQGLRLLRKNKYYTDKDKTARNEYERILYGLSSAFYMAIKYDNTYSSIENSGGMIHDFNGSIRSMYQQDHTDKCIKVIEKYVKTGIFDEYHTNYTGCNIPKFLSRKTTYRIYKDPTKKYKIDQLKFAPAYSKEELKELIRQFEEMEDSWMKNAYLESYKGYLNLEEFDIKTLM